ncbi:MAG TPA: substrate-binding domain-containing protein [Solirubrobacteraceae bacterium]|jgi:ribose transport system substrate-binding protein|nr:substrate-binding domain-containing protein [Solirubrobacteraceae bacterium]
MRFRRKVLVLTTAAASLAAAAIGLSGSTLPASASGKYTIVLSNNYMGNQWRPQMENDAKYIASQAPYNKEVNLEIRNANLTPTAQIQSLQTVIREKPAAIMVDAASPTALNPTITEACNAGILVFTFDQVVTAPCAYKLPEDYEKEALDMANWLGTELHGKGNILVDTGLPGIAISSTFLSVWKSTLAKKYPAIKIVGTFSSEYAPGPELQGVSSDLAKGATVNGILSGGYCSSDIQALQRAGRKLVPMTCLDVNGNEQQCAKYKLPCFFFGAPAWVSGVAVQHIVNLLSKKGSYPKSQPYFEKNFVTKQGDIKFKHTQVLQPLTPGVNYYPSESSALITPITYSPWKITPAIALGG